jgi:hypothetical protein
VVRPLNQQIGYWQATAARLVSIGERLRAQGRYSPTQVEELEALEHTISTHRRRLEAAVAGLPEELRMHGRIRDTKRALESVSGAAERARALLSGSGTERR